MNSLVKLPSDSLYKFCTFLGIIVFVQSAVMLYTISNELRNRIESIELEVGDVAIGSDFLKRKSDFNKVAFDKYLEMRDLKEIVNNDQLDAMKNSILDAISSYSYIRIS